MYLLFAALLLTGSQGSLDSYHMQIDTSYLSALYADPLADLQFPAFVETPAGACSILAGFRGGTSLFCPKKSWKLELRDVELLGCSHVLLDAQYRDRTFMRNALGLLLSRELGLPAPLTEHVEFYVNDEYYGVYVQVERIDSCFYERNGLPDGPLFKSLSHLGRLLWQPCDTSGTAGFEAERGWDSQLYRLRSLIDRVNLGFPHGVDVDDFITNAAIALAIVDEDAITKNYYLHLMPDGSWRYYPWDRDATFGNRWDGEYHPEWVERTSMFCFNISPLLNRMLREPSSRQLFHDRMLQTASLMEGELPGVIDSIYLEIRESVYADTMKNGTNEDFDQDVTVLREALMDRAAFLPGTAEIPSPLEVTSMTLSRWDFPSAGQHDSVTLTIEFQSPPDYAGVSVWSDGGERFRYPLYPVDPSHLAWSMDVVFAETTDHLRFSVDYTIPCPHGTARYYYPAYGYAISELNRTCAPTARRSQYPAHHSDLQALDPVRYTPFLWSIPLVNASATPLDLSFYGFQAGDPPARLFFPSDAVVPPGDTIHITNNSELLKMMMPGNEIVFGDLVLDSPGGTELLVLDPSWHTALSSTLGNEVPCDQAAEKLILSEICHGGGAGDWIELFNYGRRTADLSGWLLIDGAMNTIHIPDRVNLEPGKFLVICRSYDDFGSYYDDDDMKVVEVLGFGLNGDMDGVCVMDGDRSVSSVIYSRPAWPLSGDLLYLRRPDMPVEMSCSWEGDDLPGTPGEPNPGWPTIFFRPVIMNLWPNPAASSVSVEYLASAPGEIMIYDLTGRLVTEPVPLGSPEGSISLELPRSLATGVYFAVVRSMNATASSKFVLLR